MSDPNLSRWNVDRIDGEVLVCRGRHEKGLDCEWERYVAEDRFLAAEARASTAEAEVERLTRERDAAIKVCDMNAMSGGFSARWAENATKRAEAAEARIAVLEAEVAALRADPARAAEEWNYDMDAAPPGPDVSVLVTVPSLHAGHPPIVGEAYYCADGQHKGWWWAGTSPSDYYASPIRETNADPIAWRRLPEPAAVRALAQEKGDGDG